MLKMTKDHMLVEEPMEICSTLFHTTSNIDVTSNYYEIKQEEDMADYYDRDLESWYGELVQHLMTRRIDVNVRDSLSQTPLHIAVRRQDARMVEHLLSNGAIVDLTDEDGRTPLHAAASRGSVELVELLLHHGADPRLKSHDGFNVLFFAVQSGCAELVRLLVERGCDVNELVADQDLDRRYSYLHSAVERNNLSMVETLLSCNADVNQHDCYGVTCLHVASRQGRREIAERLLAHGARIHERDRRGQTALCHAVDAGHQDIFQLLLSHGADLNDKGTSDSCLLHLAVRHTNISLLTSLLNHDIDVNAVTRFGRTALHCTVIERNRPALQLLLEHGADVNLPDHHGRTPLHAAVEVRRPEVVDLLLSHGAKANARDISRQTPLHIAVRQDCIASVEFLLEHGADANALDEFRRTPLHIAARSGASVFLEPLSQHGAEIDALDFEGCTPLHHAIEQGHSHLFFVHPDYTFFAALLAHGADVDAGRENPLHLAVARRCPAFVRALLLKGADLHIRRFGRTPLHEAVRARDTECAEQLLAFGADPEARDWDGRKALDAMTTAALLDAYDRQHVKRCIAGIEKKRCPDELEGPLSKFALQCKEEVRLMGLMRLRGKTTYLGLVRAGPRALAYLARNERVVQALEGRRHRRLFPIYADIIERNFARGKRIEALTEPALERLEAICDYKLPIVPLDKVLTFLNATDMKTLIEAVPSLPVRFNTTTTQK